VSRGRQLVELLLPGLPRQRRVLGGVCVLVGGCTKPGSTDERPDVMSERFLVWDSDGTISSHRLRGRLT